MIGKFIYFFLLSSFTLVFSNKIFSQEVSYLSRGPRALLMGDAYTAIADDEFTLFYNPAGLGKNKGVSFTLLDPNASVTNILSDKDRLKNFPTGPGAAPKIADRLLDFPVYIQAGIFPTLKMGQFGFSLLADTKASLVLRNATNPIIDVNYRYDRGFVVGYAYNIGTGAYSSRTKKSSKTKTTAGTRLSIGASIKHLNRQGIKSKFDLFGTTLLNKIASGAKDVNALKSALGYSQGSAWGFDTGVEYAVSSGRSTFTSAISILDIGATRFNKTQGTAEVPKQDMMINTGVAYKQDFGIFDYTLSADLHPLTGPTDLERKFHFGSEFSFPFISLLAGWSEGYLSYGAAVKIWPVKVIAGFYGIEVGSKYREQVAKRLVVYVDLFDFSIDL